MKKIVLALVLVSSVLVSCHKEKTSTETGNPILDTVKRDSVKVDTVQVDSVKVDSVKVK
jgi:hypothetical protein